MVKKSVVAIVAVVVVAMIVIVGVGNRAAGGSTVTTNDCAKRCMGTYKQCVAAEDAWYAATKPGCGGDRACLKALQARHQANLDACRTQLETCKASCP
jgi:uncharacterized lipoprotein NlpE involved in copper resistance